MNEREQLEQAIAALEAQRAVLGDAVTEIALTPLREKLAALDSPRSEAQRKLITVLFADVSGFTAMSETMDAEDVTDTMNALWTRLDAAIKMHGGEIDKHIGDAVMALFGAQAAAEDDPEQAIRAALAMQSELAAFRDARRVALAMRIGVNTGPVLYGQVGTVGEVTAMGDTVNLASRLEHAAPVGGILISHDTFRHVRGVFDVQPLDPISVKGKSEPVRVYVVQRARPRAFRVATRGVEGVETRMIGRDADFKRLQDAYRMAVGNNKTQIVTVVGDAGVGKSRLLYEFDQWLDLLPESILYFKGRALSETTRLPYALLRNLLAYRFEIRESDSAAEVRQKLERGLAEFLAADAAALTGISTAEKAHYVGYLVGFDLPGSPYLPGGDPRPIVQIAHHYLTQFFTAISQQPTVMFLEDIHWADDRSLDFISRLPRELPNQRLLIVGLTRPTLFERSSAWSDGYVRLDLKPLSPDDSHVLVNEILQRVDDLPADLSELVVKRAEGNPYYVEELVKMLLEDGVIVKGEERWHVETDRLKAVRVPPTLTGVLQARLDSLPKAEKAVLQRASVVGRIFWDAAVAKLRAETDTLIPDVQPTLAALFGRELVFPRETSAFTGAEEYIFKHALLRDVTYETVLKRLRRVYHQQVADWLVQISGDRVKEYSGVIGEHYAVAGEAGRAVDYLRRAGEQALAISSYPEALAQIERALGLLADEDATRVPLLKLAGDVYVGLSDYVRAKAGYDDSLRLALRKNHPTEEAAALTGLGHVAAYYSDYGTAQKCHEESRAIFRDLGDQQGVAKNLDGLGRIALDRGEYSAAQKYYEESLVIRRELGDRLGIASSLNNLGLIADRRGEYSVSWQFYQESLQILRDLGDRQRMAVSLNNIGAQAQFRGEYSEARAAFDESLAIRRTIGDRLGIAVSLNNLGILAFHRHEFGLARMHFQESLAIRRVIGDRLGLAIGLNNLGEFAMMEGDYAAARSYHQESLDIRRDIGDRLGISISLTNLGLALLALGEVEQGRHLLYGGLREAQEIGDVPHLLAALAGIAEWRAKAGEKEKAVELLALVERQQATEQQNRDAANKLLVELRAALPPLVFEAAVERGKTLDLETVVKQFLEEAP